jgi:hypothetical protein
VSWHSLPRISRSGNLPVSPREVGLIFETAKNYCLGRRCALHRPASCRQYTLITCVSLHCCAIGCPPGSPNSSKGIASCGSLPSRSFSLAASPRHHISAASHAQLNYIARPRLAGLTGRPHSCGGGSSRLLAGPSLFCNFPQRGNFAESQVSANRGNVISRWISVC